MLTPRIKSWADGNEAEIEESDSQIKQMEMPQIVIIAFLLVSWKLEQALVIATSIRMPLCNSWSNQYCLKPCIN